VTRPRLLDLFCGAGGASMGYYRAGFDVVGVDIKRQRHYPFTFVRADAMTYPLDGFDVVAGSPPCRDHSPLAYVHGDAGTAWMLHATVERLRAWGGPWVVENVAGADLPGSLTLCGSEFGLRAAGRTLRRHRQFASSVFLMGAGGCHCRGHDIGGVYGHGGGATGRGFKFAKGPASEAMGIDWMSTRELAQAIPPVMTEHIGEQLLAHIGARR
jgi:DNA (cytosine-5)-methyltransferase 1